MWIHAGSNFRMIRQRVIFFVLLEFFMVLNISWANGVEQKQAERPGQYLKLKRRIDMLLI